MKLGLMGAAAALLFAIPPVAYSAPVLSFSLDGGAATTCADNAACDVNPVLGVVTFFGPIGDFSVNVTTGSSAPVLTGGNPLIALNSVDIQTSGGAHTLVIGLSDTGFQQQGQISLDFGGTLNGTGALVRANAFVDASNTLFLQTTAVGQVGPFGPGAFSGNLVDGGTPGGPYSVTQVLTLTTSAAPTTFQGSFAVNVPEPGTLALVSLALLGFGVRRRGHVTEES